jgi:hypothetical protein
MTNWALHFQKVSRNSRVSFGTIGGLQTIAELKDLVVTHDDLFNKLDIFFSTTPNLDPDLINDYAILKARYKVARDSAQTQIDLNKYSFIPDAATPAQKWFDAILVSLQINYPGPYVKGDLPDVVTRSGANTGPMIQPTATDYDLKGYQAADTTLKTIESVTKPSTATQWKIAGMVGAVLVGLIAVAKIIR